MLKQTLIAVFAFLFGENSVSLTQPLAPSGQFIQLADGRHISILCVGRGTPTILLDAGLSLGIRSWRKVQPDLGKIARTCAYNRAGYVPSEPGPMPRDAVRVAKDMHALLVSAGLPAPYILVGHSIGGVNVRMFANLYPQDVAGLVLIDPVFHDDNRLMSASSAAAAKALSDDDALSRKCIGAIAQNTPWSASDASFKDCGPPPSPNDPAGRAMARTVMSEFDQLDASDAEVRASQSSPAHFPMVVLTSDSNGLPLTPQETAKLNEVKIRAHRSIAATSTRGRQELVANSGHVIQMDQPNAVIQAVQEVVNGARMRPQ